MPEGRRGASLRPADLDMSSRAIDWNEGPRDGALKGEGEAGAVRDTILPVFKVI